MAAKTFIDSNILIYGHDKGAGVKQQMAIQALSQLWLDDCGVLSLQVLQEFYSVITRKSKLPQAAAQQIVGIYYEWCGGEAIYADLQAAFRIQSEAQIGFWDSLMLAAAARFGATRLLSEDLNHGQMIAGIEIVNPFGTP
jgi:predicted nucleic acid-binding protein